MKTFKELREALTTQQRMKRSISSRKSAKKAAIKRARSLKKPPSQEKVMLAVKRAVRQKALAVVDKAGVYKTASIGVKAGIEKKADIKVKKAGAKWEKRLKPQVKKAMKAAYQSRMGKGNPES